MPNGNKHTEIVGVFALLTSGIERMQSDELSSGEAEATAAVLAIAERIVHDIHTIATALEVLSTEPAPEEIVKDGGEKRSFMSKPD